MITSNKAKKITLRYYDEKAESRNNIKDVEKAIKKAAEEGWFHAEVSIDFKQDELKYLKSRGFTVNEKMCRNGRMFSIIWS